MPDAVRREIHALRDLPDGWHFGEGIGAHETVVQVALDVHDSMIANGIENIEVFPAIDGGILISGHFGNEVLDVSCRPDGTMEIDHEVDNVLKEEKQGLNWNHVKTYLEKLNWNKKRLYEYFIPGISAGKGRDLQVRLFSPPAGTPGFQFSIPNVLEKPVETSVAILQDSTKVSLTLLSYSGESSPDAYPTIPFSIKSHQ
ncbi:MAG: hypothetical protein OXF20_09175 [Gammaproteobacteria bacterium]|nr:hypothetical protein [Gammaproteobacteria bacterium]